MFAKEALASRFLGQELIKYDYEEDFSLGWIGPNFNAFDFQAVGINGLKNFKPILPKQNDNITKSVTDFYVTTGELYNKIYEIQRDIVKDCAYLFVKRTRLVFFVIAAIKSMNK